MPSEDQGNLARSTSSMPRTLSRFRSASMDSLIEFNDEPMQQMSHEMEALVSTMISTKGEGSPEHLEVEALVEPFSDLFQQYLDSKGEKISWSEIKTPDEKIRPYDQLKANLDDSERKQAILSKLAVLKLNGGLGTSMGCVGPKSVISVRNDATFLDLCVKQIQSLNRDHSVDVPLLLMNSFNTDSDTKKVIRKYREVVTIKTFHQNRFPRVLKETLQPLPKNFDNPTEWYPPGHGDLYRSLEASGQLDALLADGKEWLFISNIDNLGATVDLSILDHITQSEDLEFVMEVTNKTRADVKGGTLITVGDCVKLLEVAQVPKEHLEDFKSVNKFKVFNTNNLWVNLKAVKAKLAAGLEMEVIENKKVLEDGRVIIQLEQAVGAAIQNFNAIGINVPRSRFLPVKKTSDLLLVMSNLYHMSHGTLLMNERRVFKDTPIVKLGDHFKKVKHFLSRFENVPDILALDHLTVSGDVHFGRDVQLRGTVIIIANEGDRIDIPSGSILENKIVSGNLRILEH